MRSGRSLHASDSDFNFVQSGACSRPFRKLDVNTGQLSRRVSGGMLEWGLKSYLAPDEIEPPPRCPMDWIFDFKSEFASLRLEG
jgi:hypothetical protein